VIRVLVVDDSSLIRRLVTSALEADPELQVAGTACNGLEALTKVKELNPDVVTLDIEMPELDGLGALQRIRVDNPRLPIIMFSTLTERGARQTLEALALGASDYVTKPSNTGSVGESIERVRQEVVPRIKALAGARRIVGLGAAQSEPRTKPLIGSVGGAVAAHAPATTLPRPAPRPAKVTPELLVIGCSTGGPDALTRVLSELPGDLPVPVLAVQHMPPVFTTMFAQRLDNASPLSVREAVDGDVAVAGQVLLAPGDFHMRLVPSATGVKVRLDQGPQLNFCRPAVDALFVSAAEVYGDKVLALVLTGMGHDGLVGCQELEKAGSFSVVQDEATSVVWGMPGAVATAGLAHEVLPLESIGSYVAQALTSR
jgi:two-component system chemotaxis response regulator CheB